jgi:hypothetical protein
MAFFTFDFCPNYEKPDFSHVPTGDSIELRRISFVFSGANQCRNCSVVEIRRWSRQFERAARGS